MNNNDYTDIKFIEDKIYIRINGIDEIFIDNYNSLCIDLKSLLDGFKYKNILGDIIILKTVSENSIYLNICTSPKDDIFDIFLCNYKPNEKIDLKPEVGYEIINKLKELYGDELDEE